MIHLYGRYITPRKRKCIICNLIFFAEWGRQKYCSEKCRKKGEKILRKKNYKKSYSQKYYREHKEHLKKLTRECRKKLRLEVLIHYGGNPPKCACCGENHIEFLTIDHMNNDGAKHRRKTGMHTGHQFNYWLKRNNFPKEFQVLCWNCNCSRTHMGYCPHQRESKR